LNTAKEDILHWESFRKGDREAFATLFRNHYPALYRYGSKFTTDHQQLEDGIQELFIELWKSNSRNTVISVRSYLLKSLKYKLLRGNSKKRHTLLPADGDWGFEWSHETFLIAAQESEEKRQKVLKAVEQLSPRQKEIVYLKYYQNLSYDELGEVMNINYQVARNLLYQAMKMLKKNITVSLLLALFSAISSI
jgi:RNA polymerase sigma-70 factor (ECF subfamily)